MNTDYMMSVDNPFGVRPDEVVGAITGGYVSSAPTVAQMQTAIQTYNNSSSVDYSAEEVSNFNKLASYLNQSTQAVVSGVKSAVTNVQQQLAPIQQLPVQQVQSVLPQLPLVASQQFLPSSILNNPIRQVNDNTEGILSKNLEQYIVLGVMFLTVSSILGLFRR